MRNTKNATVTVVKNHFTTFFAYPTPININYLCGFGSFCLVIQIPSGVFLEYSPNSYELGKGTSVSSAELLMALEEPVVASVSWELLSLLTLVSGVFGAFAYAKKHKETTKLYVKQAVTISYSGRLLYCSLPFYFKQFG